MTFWQCHNDILFKIKDLVTIGHQIMFLINLIIPGHQKTGWPRWGKNKVKEKEGNKITLGIYKGGMPDISF